MTKKLITILTPTGARPQVFKLCESYVQRQSVPNDIEWVVIDDTLPPNTPHRRKEFKTKGGGKVTQLTYPSSKQWRPGINTQRPNLDIGIPLIHGDYVFTIEDDDWYRADYMEAMLYQLKRFPVVGQCFSRYFNAATREYKEWGNYLHCSLAETAFRRSELDRFERAVNSGDLFIDIAFWRIIRDEGVNCIRFNHQGLACGMKGLPGRMGIGSGHTPDKSFTKDLSFKQLKAWVGVEDAQVYIDMATKQK